MWQRERRSFSSSFSKIQRGCEKRIVPQMSIPGDFEPPGILKQMRINIPGYGKKQPKNPDTGSLVRSLHSLRKSMRKFHVQV